MDFIDSDLRSSDFSVQTGYYLAHASNAAYGVAGDWPEKLGLSDSVRSFECGQFHGFVALQGDVAVAAFRGTESVGNALTDAETSLVHNPSFPGLVHSGFAGAAEAVYPTVRILLSTIGQHLPVFVTGHSLGGAMATLVAYRLASDGFRVRAVYTYGSPRPGDRHFRDAYEIDNYRFVNDNDLVPHLPLRWCYKHVGDLKLLSHDGELLEDYDDWKDKKRQLVRHAKHVQRAHRHDEDPPLRFDQFDWLADHHMDGYIDGIRKLLPRVPRRREPAPSQPARPGLPLHVIDQPAAGPRRPKYLDPPKAPAPSLTANELAAAFFKQTGK